MTQSTMFRPIVAKTALVANSAPVHELDRGTPARPTSNQDVLILHAANCNATRATEARKTYKLYQLVAFDHQTGRARLRNPQGQVYMVSLRTLECECRDCKQTLRTVADKVEQAGHLRPILLCKHPHIIHMLVCDEVTAQGVDWNDVGAWHGLDAIPAAIRVVYPDLPRFPPITEKNRKEDWQ